MSRKASLGQFLTKNKDYILTKLFEDMDISVCGSTFVDPFAGERDLIDWIEKSCGKVKTEAYDIDTRLDGVDHRDSLMDPPDLKGKYVVTNPPYLAKNKTKIYGKVFEYYNTDDLYKASLKMMMGWDASRGIYSIDRACEGGFIIVPLNFLSDRDHALRSQFFYTYRICSINIFEEQVFSDTSYVVCSFGFRKKTKYEQEHKMGGNKVDVRYYPGGQTGQLFFNINNRHTAGYEFQGKISFTKNTNEGGITVRRLRDVEKEILKDGHISNLYLRAVDTGTEKGRIKLTINKDHHYGICSDRTFATLVLSQKIKLKSEKEVCSIFNRFVEEYREKYHSLFLTNFRNSTSSYARKRIDFRVAFDLIYCIVNGLIK